MCGIAGIIRFDQANRSLEGCVNEIQAMTHTLEHRGPDGNGFVSLQPKSLNPSTTSTCLHATPYLSEVGSNTKVLFGHRRLSIIDLEGSAQPLCNEDGTVWVTFNGEIYNYKELSSELVKKGHSLRESGDTEVLTHLWEEYGEDMLKHLNGMFAFAIYDTRQDKVFIARDRFGEKPLYYRQTSTRLSFASELQAFWQQHDFDASINNSALSEYLRHAYVPSPLTIYQDIHSLAPGHSLTLERKLGRISIKKYWAPQFRVKTHFDYDEFEFLLNQAVKSRLIADLPVGLFLSGGLDSSVIAHSASQTIGRIKTFNIDTSGQTSQETAIATEVAAAIKADHHSLSISSDFAYTSEQLARNYGQPFADFSSIPTFLVSKATKKHVSVALSGDGGDEVFFGYDRYFMLNLLRSLSYVPNTLKQIFCQALMATQLGGRFSNGLDLLMSSKHPNQKGDNRSHMFHDYWLSRLQTSQASEKNIRPSIYTMHFSLATSELPSRWAEVDQAMYLPDDILTKVDIASMANSLECRAPMLDHRLVEYLNALDLSSKIPSNSSKAILKQYAKRHLPTSVTQLKKTGFTIPLSPWLRSNLKDWAHGLLFARDSLSQKLFDGNVISELWLSHQQGRFDHGMRLWQLIAIELWHKHLPKGSKL